MPGKASGRKLSIRRIVRLAREEQRLSAAAVRLLIVGRGGALQALATAVDARSTEDGDGPVPVECVDVGERSPSLRLGADDVVLVASAALGPHDLRAVVQEAHDARAGLLVAVPADDVRRATRAALEAGALSTEIEVFEPGVCLTASRLAEAVARVAGKRAPALAARLPWLRPATVSGLIRRAALENAAIGALVFLPGADMPVMTINQIRLVLRIATAYGVRVEPRRAPEVLGVIVAGLGLRRLAQQGLKVMPVAGWALKGVIGYGGTIALGKAIVAYYESGAHAALDEASIELPDAVQSRLPSPVVGLVHERLRGRLAESAVPDSARAHDEDSNEARSEPTEKIETGANDEEGGGRWGARGR